MRNVTSNLSLTLFTTGDVVYLYIRNILLLFATGNSGIELVQHVFPLSRDAESSKIVFLCVI